MPYVKFAVIGVGNCASALIQGLHYYKEKTPEQAIGLMHWNMGGYTPDSLEVVAAFDIDRRKVGKDLSEAIFAPPNCTQRFCQSIGRTGVIVQMGQVLDGVSEHMKDFDEHRTFMPADAPQPDQKTVINILKESGAEVLLNYLPVGSEQATRFYAECAGFHCQRSAMGRSVCPQRDSHHRR